jgi:Peptidase A4 family
MGEAPSIHRSRARAARALRTAVVAVLLAALATSCGSPAPTPLRSPTAAAIASPTPSATPRATPRPTVKPTPSPSATPAPSGTPIVGAEQTLCPGHAASAHRAKVSSGVSRNWAGYVVGATRGHVTCVEGTWTQPEVTCPATGHTSVAVWVGIDGSSAVGSIPDSSATLAQVGTFVDCTDGQAQDAAWYEFLPDLSRITPFALDVTAGDTIWAQVRWLGKGEFIATLINLTRRVGATQRWTLRSAPLLTAEWIVEDPAAECSGTSCTFVDLARFAPVSINGAVTVSGTRYRLTSIPFPYLRTAMSRSGGTLATPSSLTSTGFKVTWKAG